MRRSALMYPDFDFREFLNQPSGRAGVIKVDMGQQNCLGGLIAKRGEQALDGFFRPRVDYHAIHQVGCDRSGLVKVK